VETEDATPGRSAALLPWLRESFRSNFLRAVGQTLAVRLVSLAAGMVTTVILARALGPSGRGVYAVAGAIGATGIAFGNLGLQTSNTFYVSRDKSLLPRLMANSAVVSLGIAPTVAVAFWIVFLAAPDTAPVQGTLLWLALLAVPIGLAYLLFQNLLLGLQEFRAYNIVDLATRLGGLVLLLAILAAGVRNVSSLFAASIAPNAAAAVWAWARARAMTDQPARASVALLRTTLSYGLRAYLGAFFAFMLLRSDLLIVKYDLGAARAGYYSVAVSLADLLYVVPTIVGLVIFPRLASILDGSERRRLAGRATLALTALMTLAAGVAALLARPGIDLVFGTRFAPAATAFSILAAAMIFYGPNNMVSNYAAASGYPWFAVWIWLVGLVANVALNLALIPALGITGSALASLICYALVAVSQATYFFRPGSRHARQA
jgi:antigen flippase